MSQATFVPQAEDRGPEAEVTDKGAALLDLKLYNQVRAIDSWGYTVLRIPVYCYISKEIFESSYVK